VPHDFVARNDSGSTRGKITLDKVEVRAANPTNLHLDEDLVGAGLWDGAFDEPQ
jgi:hypothetical protein